VRLLEASGRPVDVRLRPAGSKGPLVASVAGYRAYRDRGELAGWERLALVRARPVAGSEPARAAVLAFLGETLYAAEPPAALAAEVWEMRRRLEGTAEAGDFKRGSGGLVDLEFLAQYLALAHGWRVPAVRLTGTEATFQAAAAARVLPAAEAHKAVEAHRFLRRLEMRARVLEGRPVKTLPADPAALDSLARRMGLASGAKLKSEFETHTAAARALLERTLAV
jgi:glutamate-ammonia-ligase adenylyltransferase